MADNSKLYNSTRGLVGNLGDVRRTNNFVVTITDITDGNNLDLVIQRAFLPKVSLQVLEVRRGNDAIKLAGVASWQGGQITILDVVSTKELNKVIEWFNNTYDTETGQIGFAKDYKKKGYITEYTQDGKNERVWQINGIWISDFDPGSLNAAEGALKEIALTLQIDPSPIKPTE